MFGNLRFESTLYVIDTEENSNTQYLNVLIKNFKSFVFDKYGYVHVAR